MKRYVRSASERSNARARAFYEQKEREKDQERKNAEDRELYAEKLQSEVAPVIESEIKSRIFDVHRAQVNEYFESQNLPVVDDAHYGSVNVRVKALQDYMLMSINIDAGQYHWIGLLSVADIVTGGDGRRWFRGWSRCPARIKRELESYADIISDAIESVGLDIIGGPKFDTYHGILFQVIDDGYEELT